jgi:hypothetical protein
MVGIVRGALVPVGAGTGVLVLTGGVYTAVWVWKNEATRVSTPSVKTKSISVVGSAPELPPQAASKVASPNRHKIRPENFIRFSNFDR